MTFYRSMLRWLAAALMVAGITAPALAGEFTMPGNRTTLKRLIPPPNGSQPGVVTIPGPNMIKTSTVAPTFPLNAACSASVASNNLTINLIANDGNAPSPIDPVLIPVRSGTATTGTQDILTITAPQSITIASGATMGLVSATAGRIWVVGFNDAGTFRLGVVNALSGTSIMALRDNVLSSSTLTPGNSAQVIYTTGAAVTSKGMRLLCFVDLTEATAGTYASAPTLVQAFGPGIPKPGDVVQVQRTDTGAYSSGNNNATFGDTIPTNSQGFQVMTSPSFAPASAADILSVTSMANTSSNAGTTSYTTLALFRDSTTNALAANTSLVTSGWFLPTPLNFKVLAGSTSSTQFKVREIGSTSSTFYFNGAGSRYNGGVMDSFIEVDELMG